MLFEHLWLCCVTAYILLPSTATDPQRPRRFPLQPAGKWPAPRRPSPAPVGAEGRPRLRTTEATSGGIALRAGPPADGRSSACATAPPSCPCRRLARGGSSGGRRDGTGGRGGRWREAPSPAPLPAREVNAGPPTAGRGGAGPAAAGIGGAGSGGAALR